MIDSEQTSISRRFILQATDPGVEFVAPHETLRELRCQWNDVVHTNPDYLVGLVIFGSAVKGSFTLDSDIDAVIICDPTSGDDSIEHVTQSVRLKDEWLTRTVLGHPVRAFTLEVSRQSIAEDVAMMVGNNVDVEPTKNEAYIAPRALIFPFMLQVGEGKISDYRKMILDEIARTNNPDRNWRVLADNLLRFEEFSRRAVVEMPRTIQGAYRYFNLTE